MCLLLLLLIGFLLFRSGKLGPPPWVRKDGERGFRGPFAGPEAEARRILAERLANGEISTEEYLERISVLDHERPTPPKS